MPLIHRCTIRIATCLADSGLVSAGMGTRFAGDGQVDGYDEHSLEGAIPRAAKAFVEADRAAAAREQAACPAHLPNSTITARAACLLWQLSISDFFPPGNGARGCV